VPRDLKREGASGLVRIALELAREQVAQGHTVELHGWRPSAGPRRYDLLGVKIQVTRGWGWARTSRVDARMIAPLLMSSALSPDASIAHVHSEPHLLLAPRARARLLHYHTPVPARPPRAYGWLVRRAARVVCCSDFIRRQFLSRVEYPSERAVVVHGGIDLRDYQRFGSAPNAAERRRWGIAPDETAILYAGAVVAEKGLVELLSALQRLRGSGSEPRWRLLIAGDAGLWRTIDASPPDGRDAYTARALVMSRGLPVSWLGVVAHEDMPGLYAAADIVTCPSTWDDPFPTVNIEAMAAGRPVVASRVGGVPEAVQDGTTGLLVRAGDDTELCAALASLVDDPARRRRLGDAGRARSELFTSAAAAARLEALYREVLECSQ
jgi:glycosyltransferase involved in cell wall biosynthesis